MQPRHTHIIQAHYLIPMNLGCQRRLLSHGNIGGASCGHHNSSDSVRLGESSDNADFSIFPVIYFLYFRKMFCRLRVKARNKDPFHMAFLHGLNDTRHLLPGFTRPVNYLGSALADAPVQIHLGITDIFKGLFFNGQQCIIH